MVRNLEELINFKVTTAADKIQENSSVLTSSEQKGLYALRRICDPLLPNMKLPSLPQKAYKNLNRQDGSINIED